MNRETLIKAIELAGGKKAVAEACDLSYEAVRKWTKNGLPRTEWTGETDYSVVIAALQNDYSRDDLLDRSRAA
tara:strand:- start:2022 stop:2240 length:219 start_codon:yes stop_codon:yes gene_type:complete